MILEKARPMKRAMSWLPLGVLVAFVAGLFPFPAFAAGTCDESGGGSLYTIFCSLAFNLENVPKAMAVFCYAGGLVLTMQGLLNLRNYGDDPSQTPLRSIAMKFALAAMLIGLPLAIQVVVGSMTGQGVEDGGETVERPKSYDGNGLSGLRGR
jgi:hypothetical protein